MWTWFQHEPVSQGNEYMTLHIFYCIYLYVSGMSVVHIYPANQR